MVLVLADDFKGGDDLGGNSSRQTALIADEDPVGLRGGQDRVIRRTNDLVFAQRGGFVKVGNPGADGDPLAREGRPR